MRVLVVSHIPLLADAVANALQKRFGFQALPAYSPSEAEENASIFNFDVAVVDWERSEKGSGDVAPGRTLDAVSIGLRLQHLQPRCKIVLYREQIPDELGGAPAVLEHLKSEGFCVDCISVTDKYETLYDMLRQIAIQLVH